MDNYMFSTQSNLRKRLPIYFILLLMVLLTSCSSSHRKDGPPNFYVDETKIPNATPKVERLSKYGNMPSYTVFGKRYYTMRSSKNYDEVGTASWYGTQFHAHSTSNGERYNMLGMTAAHKTLPLPTYVEVTNLRNHRTVIVKVNDRGPFESNRIIDLSYVAAKKLGMLGHGTATVRVKAIDPRTYGKSFDIAKSQPQSHRSTYATKQSSSKGIYIQVGAFRNKSNALQLQHRLQAKVSAPVKVTYPSSQSKLYRVQVGPIYDGSTAAQLNGQLKHLGIKSSKTYGA